MKSNGKDENMDKLIIQGVDRSFDKTKVLRQINLEISNGIFGLLGENGAGKTTLMRIIATVLKPDKGEISLGDINWSKDPHKVRQMLGYLPQEFGAFKNITAAECLKYIAQLKGIKSKEECLLQIEQVLKEVNLFEAKDRKIGGFSGGMKRRLGIAQALLNNPTLIIVDEPTAGLDPAERIRFRNLLRQLGKNRIVILSTHIVEDIEATCQNLAVIKGGTSVQFSSQQELSKIASGKVWTWKLSNEAYNRLGKDVHIVSSKIHKYYVEARIISEIKPGSGAEETDPTIEEGYLVWNMEQEKK